MRSMQRWGVGVGALVAIAGTASGQLASISNVNATGISETVIAGTDGSFDQEFFTGGFNADGMSASGGTDSGIVTSIANASSVTTLNVTMSESRSGIPRIDFVLSARSMIEVFDADALAFAETSASIGGSDTLIVVDILQDTGYKFTTELITPGAAGGEVSLSLMGADEGFVAAGEPLLFNFAFGISARTDIGRLFNEAEIRGTLLLPTPGAAGVFAMAGLFASRRRRV
ncbi:MAG: hypothetical protein AAF297_04490 [Planctomycetota bacterium]